MRDRPDRATFQSRPNPVSQVSRLSSVQLRSFLHTLSLQCLLAQVFDSPPLNDLVLGQRCSKSPQSSYRIYFTRLCFIVFVISKHLFTLALEPRPCCIRTIKRHFSYLLESVHCTLSTPRHLLPWPQLLFRLLQFVAAKISPESPSNRGWWRHSFYDRTKLSNTLRPVVVVPGRRDISVPWLRGWF